MKQLLFFIILLNSFFTIAYSKNEGTGVCENCHSFSQLEFKNEEEFLRGVLCKSDFDRNQWEKYLPAPGSTLSEESIRLYLLMFAKPNGFDEKKHLAILSQAARMPALKKEFLFAIQAIQVSPSRTIVNRMRSDFRVYVKFQDPPFDDRESCRSEKEMRSIREKSFKYAYEFSKQYNNTTAQAEMFDWEFDLAPHLASLRHLSDAQKNEVKKPFYRSLANDFAQFYGISTTKAVVFTKNKVRRLFGEEVPIITDTAKTSDKEDNIISSDVIEIDRSQGVWVSSSTYKKYGVYTKSRELRGDEPEVREFSWKTGGKKFSAIARTQENSSKYVPKGNSPDYEKMWADKKLSGLIVVSDNLSSGPKTSAQYLSYYTEKGFKFGPPQTVQDTKKWLGTVVAGGVDYVFKEGHGEGNDSMLFTTSKNSRVMKGTKTLPGGKTEEVYIMSFDQRMADLGDQRYQYDDLKEWMGKRPKDSPMLYANSSCWSADQIKAEVPGVANSNFIPIGSDKPTTTFSNSKKSTKYWMLEGIRNSWDYSRMTRGMETTPRYQKGYNHFYFPNDEVYQSWFVGKSIHYQVRDEFGKPYNLDENH